MFEKVWLVIIDYENRFIAFNLIFFTLVLIKDSKPHECWNRSWTNKVSNLIKVNLKLIHCIKNKSALLSILKTTCWFINRMNLPNTRCILFDSNYVKSDFNDCLRCPIIYQKLFPKGKWNTNFQLFTTWGWKRT